MDRLQKALLISLISTSGVAWILSRDQPDMMMTLDPAAIVPFTASWTSGMVAMMFPAISPMVLLYNRIIRNNNGETLSIEKSYPLKIVLFVGCYIAVWALIGIVLLLAWSVPMNSLMGMERNGVETVNGMVLIIAGAYQFTTLKSNCLGYCESPMSFFTRRWKDGISGAGKMGIYHALYCLGCCWPYFLLLVALGWMNQLYMGLFAGIIFGEKIWSKGIWIAWAAGIGFIVLGLITIIG